MKSTVKVLLTITCRYMKHPKLQRSRFDQTLISNSWMLQENKTADIHDDGTVSTSSLWGRTFNSRKSNEEIIRITGNLLNRAAADAGLENIESDFQFEIIMGNAEPFNTVSVMTQDD